MAGFNDAPIVKRLAVPAVCLLIVFLAYSSQYLFHTAENLDPGPPPTKQTITFNVLLTCLWWTYYKACTVSPGQYDPAVAGPGPRPTPNDARGQDSSSDDESTAAPTSPVPGGPGTRWCTKCNAVKPPRAHHCRHCRRCIPKMDHHCPWTANCVSLTSFPHFLRFLIWTNLSLWYLSYLLFLRFAALWDSRKWPSYLGPSIAGLIHLTLLGLVCFVTSLALAIMLTSTVKGWLFNTTMIEGWEIDKHERLVERGGGWWDEDDEAGGFPDKVEFPYDIGIFKNMSDAMGTRNFLLWFFPFAGGPRISRTGKGPGWEYEENGFNPRLGMWPPPDPDRYRRSVPGWAGDSMDNEGAIPIYSSPEERKAAFQRRQEEDMRRWRKQRADLLAELEEVEDYEVVTSDGGAKPEFKNADGETLGDYGVDSDDDENIPLIRRIDDDDVPLGEILRRRRVVELDDTER
ncbi:hypothetical protein jhhlp_000935 [Lomentospora prolificans]|uniref:Palmitoyltransferase PFA4 n=1 Tax=Lomentospora prolificans TaxID=41688 RepID=A0A2N3NJW4_9PEZI|nr:hypothetical protein jhhlp_000935 [Lomentospora prolificans]